MKRFAAAVIFSASVASSAAWSAPPPVGSEDWEIMAPYAAWIETQHTADGRWCCTVADGRPVEARTRGDHWQVFISDAKFPNSPEGWADVPDDRVLHGANPTGFPIAWVMQGRVLCFAPAGGV